MKTLDRFIPGHAANRDATDRRSLGIPANRLLERAARLVCVATMALVIAACSTVQVGRAPALEPGATWAVLPFVNQTETPQAGLRAESITENLLRAEGVARMAKYPAALNTETLFEPADRKQADAALAWARAEKIRYAVAGTVAEWRYKVGVDGEPAAGITLQLIDVQSGEVLWAASGGSTGWSRESLSGVAQKLIGRLLQPIAPAAAASSKAAALSTPAR